MGIKITNDELLSMQPELLLELQRYLKEYRVQNGTQKESENSLKVPDEAKTTPASLEVLSKWDLHDAVFEEVEDASGKFLGTRVTQNNVTYIARQWRMTDEVKAILAAAANLGFDKFWRFNHPQNSYLEGNIKYLKPACAHIGCSVSHDSPWIFVLGAESRSTRLGVQTIKEITFNRVYQEFMDNAVNQIESPLLLTDGELRAGTYKIQKGGGKCYTTHPRDFQNLIKYFAEHLAA